jgi:hypothetical protein
MATFKPQNVLQVDDRAGNHYWIFTVQHVTGSDSLVEVDNSCISASIIGLVATTAGACTVADAAANAVKEVTVASAVASGLVTVIARFSGSAAGSSSSKIDG